jgi:hypothetical protein
MRPSMETGIRTPDLFGVREMLSRLRYGSTI